MGNPNRFEGQNIDFYYRFSRLFCETLIFQSLQKGRSKEKLFSMRPGAQLTKDFIKLGWKIVKKN
jgi:hypothetical protein